MSDPVAKIQYNGAIHVRAYRRGVYLGEDHLETLIERVLGARYGYGAGWDGHAVVSIAFYDEPPHETEEQR